MTKVDAQSFVQKILTGLWAEWEPTDIQLSNWMEKLQNCEYQRAKTAVENVWRTEKIQHRRPPQGRIFEALDACGEKREKPDSELPPTTISISCIEPPPENPNRTEHRIPVYPDDLSRMNDPDFMRNCGHYVAQRFAEQTGGQWIVVIETPKIDSGLRGTEARDAAFADILNGEDTKTKRWLQRYFDTKNRRDEPADRGGQAGLATEVLNLC
jgi:hypothetical protein